MYQVRQTIDGAEVEVVALAPFDYKSHLLRPRAEPGADSLRIRLGAHSARSADSTAGQRKLKQIIPLGA